MDLYNYIYTINNNYIMVVTKSGLDKCLDYTLKKVESIEGIKHKKLYLFGGCGLLMYNIYDERDTCDLDLFYPDAHLLSIYSDEFHNGGYAGVTCKFPHGFPLERAELFQLIENRALEEYIIKHSEKIKESGNTAIFLSPLEALTANKVQGYENTSERKKDKLDILNILEYKKGDKEFERKLMNLLDECNLSEKYHRLFE